jgi:prepilin-type N-terminal cleavage/methylation domain-containing protein
MCRTHPSRGFTLIELLVVISIIALLIGILLPTLNAARATARTLNCATRVKQTAFASLNYAQSHDYQLPTATFSSIKAAGGTPDALGGSGTDLWSYALGITGYLNIPDDGQVDNTDAFICPEYAQVFSGSSQWYAKMYQSYSVTQSNFIGPDDPQSHPIYNIELIRSPSELILINERSANSVYTLPILDGSFNGATRTWAAYRGLANIGINTIGTNSPSAFAPIHGEPRVSNWARFDGSVVSQDIMEIRKNIRALFWGDVSAATGWFNSRPTTFPY